MVNRWNLRNVCVSFYTRRNTTYLAQWVSRRGDAVIISGFSEYLNSFRRLSWVRPELPSDQLENCPYAELGVAMHFSSNNIYHAFFHAVPAWRALQHIKSPVMIPLVDAHAGNWVGAFNKWRAHAWEFAVRGLTREPSIAISNRLRILLTGRCACFGNVVGNTEAFEPRAVASLPTLRNFCHTVLVNSAQFVSSAGLWTEKFHPRVLYVSRQGRRSFVNEELVLKTLQRQYLLRRVYFELLSVSDQIHLLSRAELLVTMHGQALAYMPFLPKRAAVLEFALPHTTDTWRSKLMYAKWALSLKLVHFSSKTMHANCLADEKRTLHCPLVAHIGALKTAMSNVEGFLSSKRNISVSWCYRGDFRLCRA